MSTKKPENYDELYPGRFLKSGLFKGRPVTLTIAEVLLEKMPDKKGKNGEKAKGILSFRETDLQLVLNRTNGECLKGMFGKKLADWVGKRVTFHVRMVEAFGSEQEAIRVLGSPELERDMSIEMALGQKKGKATMKKTAAAKGKAEPEPEEEHDPETGEVPFTSDAREEAVG